MQDNDRADWSLSSPIELSAVSFVSDHANLPILALAFHPPLQIFHREMDELNGNVFRHPRLFWVSLGYLSLLARSSCKMSPRPAAAVSAALALRQCGFIEVRSPVPKMDGPYVRGCRKDARYMHGCAGTLCTVHSLRYTRG